MYECTCVDLCYIIHDKNTIRRKQTLQHFSEQFKKKEKTALDTCKLMEKNNPAIVI